MPNEMKSSLDMSLMPYLAPGAAMSRPATASLAEPLTVAWASAINCEKLPFTANSTRKNITPAPAINSTALTIWT